MPLILSRNPFVDDDVVLPSDLNAIATAINTNEGAIIAGDAALLTQIAPLRAFTLAAGGGLNLNITGGTMRLTDGSDVVCSNATLALPDNSTRFVYAQASGVFAQAVTLPANTLELGKVITLGGSITQVIPKPRFEIGSRYTNTQIDTLVSTAQTNAIAAAKPVLVVEAQQTTKFDLLLNSYVSVAYNSVAFGSWVGGVYTVPAGIPANTAFDLAATFRGVTRTPGVDSNIEIKLSLFVGASELQILGQGAGASGDQTVTGSWRFTASPGQEIGIRAYLTRGQNVECAGNNTRIQIYRLP